MDLYSQLYLFSKLQKVELKSSAAMRYTEGNASRTWNRIQGKIIRISEIPEIII